MAKWIEVTKPFDWPVPGKRAVKAFQPGVKYLTDAQAEYAIEHGKGFETERPDNAD